MTISENILNCLAHSGYDVDVYVEVIYEAAYDKLSAEVTPFRRQQQRLGARFSVLNKRFDDGRQTVGRIIPGELKRTYRLVRA